MCGYQTIWQCYVPTSEHLSAMYLLNTIQCYVPAKDDDLVKRNKVELLINEHYDFVYNWGIDLLLCIFSGGHIEKTGGYNVYSMHICI